jgi:hypothetical protein
VTELTCLCSAQNKESPDRRNVSDPISASPGTEPKLLGILLLLTELPRSKAIRYLSYLCDP